MEESKRIKNLRRFLGMTQEKFGYSLGVKKNTISQIESGVNNPTEAFVRSICREFNVNEQWLRTGEGEMFLQSDPDEEYKKAAEKLSDDELVRAILVEYFKLDDHGKKLLKEFVYSIAEQIVDAKQDDSAAEIDAKVQAYREQLEREAAEKESSGSPDAESIA